MRVLFTVAIAAALLSTNVIAAPTIVTQDNFPQTFTNMRLGAMVQKTGGAMGPKNIVTVLDDDFDGCTAPGVACSNCLLGWNILGVETPTCPGNFSCNGTAGIGVANTNWTIDRDVDLSALDGDIELCWDLGDNGAGGGELFRVQYDAKDGMGYIDAWQLAGNIGLDNSCAQVCVSLSKVAANRGQDISNHPALNIRFLLESDNNGDHLVLDNVVLRGAEFGQEVPDDGLCVPIKVNKSAVTLICL